MKRVVDLFTVEYGQRELPYKQALELVPGDTPVVSSSGQNNGVYGYFDVPAKYERVISVPRVGSICQASFHPYPCAIDENCLVLVPKTKLTDLELHFYAFVIRKSASRFSYGRILSQARMENLPLAPVPAWLSAVDLSGLRAMIMGYVPPTPTGDLDTKGWKLFKYTDLFEIVRGKGPSLADAKDSPGATPYVTASDFDNGVSAWTSFEPEHPGGVITVAKDGAPGAAFYQPAPFCANSHVHVLAAKAGPMSAAIGIFLATLIRQEMVKYGYSRAWGLQRMTESTVHLPATPEGLPDFAAMGHFMCGLPSWNRLPQEATRD